MPLEGRGGLAGGAPGYEPSEPSDELERSIFAAPSGPDAVCGRVMLMWCMSAMLDCGGASTTPGVEANQRTTLRHAKEPLRAKRLWMSSITPGISFTPDSASWRGDDLQRQQAAPNCVLITRTRE